MKILGENIRKLRQARGLTQQQLADIMGASNYTTISKWESGANSPRGGDLVKLSELFTERGVTPIFKKQKNNEKSL